MSCFCILALADGQSYFHVRFSRDATGAEIRKVRGCAVLWHFCCGMFGAFPPNDSLNEFDALLGSTKGENS